MFSRHEVEVVMKDLKRLDTERLVVDADGRNKGGMAVEDGETPRLQFDLHKTDSCFPPLCRHPRLAGVMQELMGVPLYIYHSKLAFKAPFVGSVQYWHQDFGYWRRNHSKPTMGSCLLMLDEHTPKTTPACRCLRVRTTVAWWSTVTGRANQRVKINWQFRQGKCRATSVVIIE